MNQTSFGWADLIVSVGVAAALLGVTVAARHQTQEYGVIVECQQNLQQIGQSLVMYQSVNDGQFPRTRYRPDAPLSAYTAPDAPDPFAPTGPAENDVTAAMFLLARVMDMPPQTFTCPAAVRHGLAEKDSFDRTSTKGRSNFRARVNDNYSLANMYPGAASTSAGYSLNHFHEKLPPTFAIVADTNPGIEDEAAATTQQSRIKVRMGNSPNHQRDGQNVLFADGSVAFFASPFTTGSDDIYRADDGGLQPVTATDAVLLPVWSDGPSKIPAIVQDRRWFLGGFGILMTAILIIVVGRGVRTYRRGRTF